MPELPIGDQTLDLNETGFLLEPDRWNDDVATALAAVDGIPELTPQHWRVVRFIRAHYVEFGLPPLVRKLCKQTRMKLSEIYVLFPAGPANGACKVAGLPDARGCV